MAGPRISLITVCYNAATTIESCILSVLAQTYSAVEYIIVDGSSTDETLEIIDRFSSRISLVISEPDKGLYDAMNKGISRATGDVIGILNADDYFAADDVLEAVAGLFLNSDTQAVYGDMDMVDHDLQPIRQWRSGSYTLGKLKRGWMPPHPAFYVRRQLFLQHGLYSLDFGTAADYELMLRLLYTYKIKAVYLNKVIVKMRLGGASNGSLQKRLKAWANDYKSMRKHGLPFPALSLLLKPFRKITQYLIKR